MKFVLSVLTLATFGSLLTQWNIEKLGLPDADFIVDDDRLQIPKTESDQDTVEESFAIHKLHTMKSMKCTIKSIFLLENSTSKHLQSYFLVQTALLKKNHGSNIQPVRSLPPDNTTSFSKDGSMVIITKLFGSEIRIYKVDISNSYQASDCKPLQMASFCNKSLIIFSITLEDGRNIIRLESWRKKLH